MKGWMMAGAGETNCPSAGQASYGRTIHKQSEAEEANSPGTGTVRYLHFGQGYHTSLSPAIRYLLFRVRYDGWQSNSGWWLVWPCTSHQSLNSRP